MNQIERIGESLVKCKFKCEGIRNIPEEGILPRCLIYEKRVSTGKGSIIIGINPGKCRPKEKDFYLKNGNTYESILGYWENKIRKIAYYQRARDIVDKLGFSGDILWSDLAKCECVGENGNVPVQTLRICIDKYLKKEIEVLPKEWVIIALGGIAFNFCALRFPNRFVIGLPHTTGSRTFHKFKKDVYKNRYKYLKLISKHKDDNGYYKAINLK